MANRLSIHRPNTPTMVLVLAPLLAILLSYNVSGAEESVAPSGDNQPEGVFSNLLDEYHSYMLGNIKGQTIWFDNFFGDRRVDEDDHPSSFVRLRTVAKYTEGEGITFPVRLRANLELPRVNRRLRLVIFGGNHEDDRFKEADDTIDPALKNGEDKDWTNLGLRYMIYKSLRDRFHFGGGLSLGWPLDYYGRIRYERLLHNGNNNVIRFTENAFWNSLTGFGETSQIDLESILGSSLTGRLSLFVTYSRDRPGLRCGVEASLFRQLSEKSALAFDLGSYIVTEPSTQIETYRIAGRYRRNFLRPWLFFEIAPELVFPLSDDGTREAVGALTTVLEIQFITP